MAQEVFNRYEHKYFLDEKTYEKVKSAIETHMELDPYNTDGTAYTISNIYFDTHDDYLVRRSLEGPVYKEKLRLRSYGVPDTDSEVFLEIKKKVGGLVNKRRTGLKLFEAYEFTETGIKPENKDYMNPQVMNEIEYFLKRYELMPKVYLAYDRIAYFEKDNPDLRISFDFNIRSRRNEVMLENGDTGEMLLPGDMCLMEIKTARAKPLWLTSMLSDMQIRRVSFSKYGTEYKRRKTS